MLSMKANEKRAKRKQVIIRLDSDIYEAIRAEAAKQRRSLTAQVEIVVESAMAADGAEAAR